MKFNELIKELNKDLKGKEMNFYDLDRYMASKGFYSVVGDDAEWQIRNEQRVPYALAEDTCKQALIFFHITDTYSPDDYDTLYFDVVVDKVLDFLEGWNLYEI